MIVVVCGSGLAPAQSSVLEMTMTGEFFLYVSKRSQRVMAALLSLVLIHVLVASCTPEPVSPMAASVSMMVTH